MNNRGPCTARRKRSGGIFRAGIKSPSTDRCGIGFRGGQCLSLGGHVTGMWPTDGATAAGGHGPQGNPAQFPESRSTPTSIPSEFPSIDVSGRALGQDEIDAAIQTTSTSKVRRVDFGGCGPVQSPISRRQPQDPWPRDWRLCRPIRLRTRSETSQRKAQPKKGLSPFTGRLLLTGLGAEVKDLSMTQPGEHPQTDCAHHQQRSVHSARIRALL